MEINIYFKLLIDFGDYKKGEVFSCFDGSIHGIEDKSLGTIYFTDKTKFKMVKNQKPTE